MKSTALASALAAAALGLSSLAQAQGWDRGDRDQDGRRGGWGQGRGAPQQDGRPWQRGQQQPQQHQPQPSVQVQPAPAPPGQGDHPRQWGGQRRDGAGGAPRSAAPAPPPYPRYGIQPPGYVQPASPPARYGPPGRPNGVVQTAPQGLNPPWQDPQWQSQHPHDGHGAERGAWRQAPRFRRGDYLPPEYRHHYVQDWRAHRLYAPPPGYQWVQVDTGDYLLIAVGTGVIANLLLGQ